MHDVGKSICGPRVRTGLNVPMEDNYGPPLVEGGHVNVTFFLRVEKFVSGARFCDVWNWRFLGQESGELFWNSIATISDYRGLGWHRGSMRILSSNVPFLKSI